MLNKRQKQQLVNTVEEELNDLDRYPYVGMSEVEAIRVDGFTVYVKLVSDDYEEE